MTSRGRGGSMSDWDPMRDDFNDTSYNAQYPDEDASESVQLDHTKLYITKLPAALSQEGFVDLFSKYGRVVHSYFSRDPQKRYAFVSFETAGEARIAMMKLNKTEPFNMSIYFAHNKNNTKTQQSQPNIDRSQSTTERQMSRHSTSDRQNHSIREDSGSVSSRGRKPGNLVDHANGNEEDDEIEGSDVSHDPKLGYNLEKIKLQRLQLMDQQLQVQQRMLIHQQRMKNISHPVTKRRLLPDGQTIQITQDNETSFTAGGGDSREASRRCVSCGARAELFCAGCRITPYCAERCQRRDWDARHRSVCHNLVGSFTEMETVGVANGGSDTSLNTIRRPRSPAKKAHDLSFNDSSSERDGKKLILPSEQTQQRKGNHTAHSARNDNRNKDTNKRDSQGGQDVATSSRRHTPAQRPLRQPKINQPTPDVQTTKPVVQPSPKPVEVPKETREPSLKNSTPGVRAAASKPLAPTKPPGSLDDTTPRKPLVPAKYMIEKLPVGSTFLVEVVSPAADCGSKQAGYVCLTLHEAYSAVYDQLCDDFKVECLKDDEEFTPRIGESFAYLSEEDGDWYRARCLSRTRAALLDAGRVVSFEPGACRRMPAAYAVIPEFMALLKTTDFEVGYSTSCTIVSASSNVLRLSVEDSSGKTMVVDAMRWLPEVEYPKEPQRPPLTTQLKRPTREVQAEKPAPVEPSPKQMEVPKKTRVEPSVKEASTRVRPVANTLSAHQLVRKPLVPTNYMIEKLAVGDTFVAVTVSSATESSKEAGYVCLTLHESYREMYDQLCEDFKLECLKDTEEYTPSLGETFAYLSEDEYFYRARCLARTRAALLDTGTVVSFAPSACRRLPASFKNVPEFTALLKTNDFDIDVSLSCTIVSASSNVLKVSVEDDSGKCVVVDAMRWLPEVEYPKEPTVPKQAATGSVIPEVPRPFVERNTVYVLLDVTSLQRACVRPCEPRLAAMFDSVLHDTVQYGINATPLKEPPQKGQTVVVKFIEDGIHYRGFVQRVNVAMNKYLIEYIEYGNQEIVPLERIYPCPPKLQLDAKPAQASLVKLSDKSATLTPAANEYITKLKDNAVELILTIPGSDKTAPSGSLVNLMVAKNCDPVSKKIEELCTPEWMKLAERGGDVLEVVSRFYAELDYFTVPQSRPFTLRVTSCDFSALSRGSVCGYEKGDKRVDLIYGELTKKITEYAESQLCKEPYLPKVEELCIMKNKRVNRWVRSVLVQALDGPGSELVRVMHIDYGDVDDVPATELRKMMPEFVDRHPAAATHFEIKDFPQDADDALLKRAMKLMQITADGFGELRVSRCRELEDNIYQVEAPELIAALTE